MEGHACTLAIWSAIAGHKLTAAEVRELVAEGETKTAATFHSSKKNADFKARLRLDEAGRAQFVFEQAKGA